MYTLVLCMSWLHQKNKCLAGIFYPFSVWIFPESILKTVNDLNHFWLDAFSLSVVCCKNLLLTSTNTNKGKIHHSLTGKYARIDQNFAKFSPMPVPMYLKTDLRNELSGFQATIYFDRKSRPKCPEGCWVIGKQCIGYISR